jgi:thiol-disulfide isomerase/thioredoxin
MLRKMKIAIKIILLVLVFTSCKSEVKSESYVINGNAKGIYNGIRVYLKNLDQNNRQVDVDTAMVMNEKFTFEGKVLGPEMFYIYVNSVTGNLPLIIENSEMTIDIDKDNLANSKITGTKTNEALIAFSEKIKAYNEKRRSLSLALREAAQVNDNEKTTALNNELNNLNLEATDFPFEFINTNSDNYYSLILLESMLKNKNADFQKIIDTYQGLDSSLKTSAKGNEILAQIESVKIILEAQKRTDIGAIAPEFSAPTPEGKMLGLNEIKGKITMIDFWAAWCGPCRRENPNIVKVYEKYHDKGLEIIGVSLDGNTRQADPKAAWIKAIEDDKLTWHQISNLNYFNGPIAKMYNIQSIPSSFILDAEGKIIAKNLRGPALEAKIAELLD